MRRRKPLVLGEAHLELPLAGPHGPLAQGLGLPLQVAK
jgi:hypothetical protein